MTPLAAYQAALAARLGVVDGCGHCDARLSRNAPLPPEVQAAVDAGVAAEREACAAILDAVVREHREESRRYRDEAVAGGAPTYPAHGEPGYFCEDFGCGSLVELAAAIRARGGSK